MPNITFPKISLTKLVSIVTALGAIGGGILAFDARYNPAPLEAAMIQIKAEIINEMRTEVAINRTALLSDMLREADDIEYQLVEHELNNTKPPRHLVDKHKQILRDIEKLQNEESNN